MPFSKARHPTRAKIRERDMHAALGFLKKKSTGDTGTPTYQQGPRQCLASTTTILPDNQHPFTSRQPAYQSIHTTCRLPAPSASPSSSSPSSSPFSLFFFLLLLLLLLLLLSPPPRERSLTLTCKKIDQG